MARVEAVVTVTNEVGLHARPAAIFVRAAQEFESSITVENLSRGGAPVDAKSPLQVIKAAIAQNHSIRIAAEGDDAERAVAALVSLIES